MKTFLNYTDLTYDEIKKSVVSRLSEDSRFANFRESEMNAVLMEIFTATTDFTNYYIERRSEESYLDSAKLRSSIILLSKMLGYIIRRPIPATANIKLQLKKLPQGASANDIISFPRGTKFTYNNKNFILKDSVRYTLTSSDISNFAAYTDYFKEFSNYSTEAGQYGNLKEVFEDGESNTPISVVQGEFRTYTIDNISNAQLGKLFQTYKILDKEFSNIFGSEDYGYSYVNDDIDVTQNFTRVALGTDISTAFAADMNEFSSKREFIIDRRSFLNNDSVPQLSASNSGSNTKYCVVRTTMDDNIELMFGDNIVSSIGAKNNENIYIKYLSTKGGQGNEVGVIDNLIVCQGYQVSPVAYTQNEIEFRFTSNSIGGADIESVDSIKVNAPEIFYSLERCVTPRDYVAFLKTLILTTKQTKNAIAWGEQEETRGIYNNNKVANIKLFNVVLFSVIADMYKKENDTYVSIDTDENVILDSGSYSHNWFRLMVMSDSVTPLREIEPALQDIQNIYDKLYTRSEITVKNIYISPMIQDFDLAGTIYLNPLTDRIQVQKKINNAVYSYLSEITDFNTPIYLSNVIDLIEAYPEVNHADVYFSPKSTINTNTTFTSTIPAAGISEISAAFPTCAIGCVFNSQINTFDKCNVRDFSSPVPGDKTAQDLYRQVFEAYIASEDYSTSTKDAIYCLMPEFNVKLQKINSTDAQYSIVWPTDSTIYENTCGISAATTTSTTVNGVYEPSERNLFLAIMKCYYDKLKAIADEGTKNKIANGVQEELDRFLANTGTCICSLRDIIRNRPPAESACAVAILNSNPNEIQHFLDNYFITYLTTLEDTMAVDTKSGMRDSYGNIVNYSMKNEIARIDLANTVYSY